MTIGLVGVGVSEQQVREGDWVESKKLRDCSLLSEGIVVLGIIRDDGAYVGSPTGDTEVFAGDTLILYGRSEKLNELDRRRADLAGDKAHEDAVVEETRHAADEQRQDQQRRQERRAARA